VKRKFFLFLIILVIINLAFVVEAYSIDGQAILAPSFTDTSQINEDDEMMLSDLFNDLIMAVDDFKNQELGEYDFKKFKQVSEKWTLFFQDYADDNILDAEDKVIVDQVIETLPNLNDPSANQSPMDHIYKFFKSMETLNPLGLGSFFHILGIPNTREQEIVKMQINEVKKHGVKNTFVISKQIVKKVNDEIVYYELIENDVLKDFFQKENDKTLIHEILREMKENNEDIQIILALEELLKFIDDKVEEYGLIL